MRLGKSASAGLEGYWHLIGYEVAIGDRPYVRVFGNSPSGELRLGHDGRISVLIVPDPSLTDAPDPLAYSGVFRCAGPELIIRIEIASIPSWGGTVQRRRVQKTGGRLLLESMQDSSTFSPLEVSRGRAFWRRTQIASRDARWAL